jgi:tight adherence protein B
MARQQVIGSGSIFFLILAAVLVGARPLRELIRVKEVEWDFTLRYRLLQKNTGRSVTVMTGLLMVFFGGIALALTRGSLLAMFIGASVAVFIPNWYVNRKSIKRREELESQLVQGVQMLASSVRAGLNLVQAMRTVSIDAPAPLREEFSHMVSEYEYGMPLPQAMDNAAERIGSSDFRLLFTALQTHRERGGDLGETLDRIAASIREIQRLEARIDSLTAQGRAMARWLSAMPAVVMGILYLIDAEGTARLFSDAMGNVILLFVVILNVIGYIWIRKIMTIDI